MNWILTHSSRQFDLVSPTAAMISPLDIAHSLSNLCRFNGHTRTHYSVAQHSLIVSSLVPEQHKLVALLHDATEAYVGDMTRPLKALMPGFRIAEEMIWQAICDRFDLNPVLPECVVRADLIALATERRDLMPNHPAEWECLRGVPPMAETIIPQSAPEAYMQYFSRLMELMQGDHRRACA